MVVDAGVYEMMVIWVGFVVFISYDKPDHFLVYLIKLELLVVLFLVGLEDSYGLLFFFILMGVVSGVMGLRVLVGISRSSGADRLSLGRLVRSRKWVPSLPRQARLV